jgi:hypothetical protein
MAVSLVSEPSDFVLPSGPKLVVVRVDRDTLRHFDSSMDPLTDADSFTRVLRKGKATLEHIRREASIKLFGADLPCSVVRMGWPQPDAAVNEDSNPLLRTRYVGLSFKQDVPAGELRPAVFELTSEPDPVDGCILFHAGEPDENRKTGHLETFSHEANMAPEAKGAA